MSRTHKVYFYTDQEVGVHWPGPDADFIVNGKPKLPNTPWPRFVWCGFPNFTPTTTPCEADIFVVRQRLIWMSTKQIYDLPYLNPRTAHRHVFFDLGSDGDPKCFRAFPDLPAIFFRAVSGKAVMKGTPTTIPWPWPVEDLSSYPLAPQGGFKLDVVFQGQKIRSDGVGPRAIQALRSFHKLNCHLIITKKFYGHIPNGPQRSEMRRTFLDTLHHGRLSLCPAVNPNGVIRYRFYEALSMGRVPVCIDDLVDDFPFDNQIDYPQCIIRLPESNLPRLGEILYNWLQEHTDQDIIDMGRYGREMWKRWMDRARWAEIIEEIVKEKLEL